MNPAGVGTVVVDVEVVWVVVTVVLVEVAVTVTTLVVETKMSAWKGMWRKILLVTPWVVV